MPPLSASLDGLTISSILDSTLLVAEWGRTPVPLLSEATHLLRNANVKIAGVVINKVDGSESRLWRSGRQLLQLHLYACGNRSARVSAAAHLRSCSEVRSEAAA